jgi:mono/diheme cytochrome c family protein
MKRLRKAAVLGIGLAALALGGQASFGDTNREIAQAGDVDADVLMREGGPLYARNCAGCHGAEGQGGFGDRLVGSAVVASPGGLVAQILVGSDARGMPAFTGLSDREIAAIATFVRNSWGNQYGPVQPSLVANGRGGA